MIAHINHRNRRQKQVNIFKNLVFTDILLFILLCVLLIIVVIISIVRASILPIVIAGYPILVAFYFFYKYKRLIQR